MIPMPRAIVEKVEGIAEQENRVFNDEEWTVIPGRIENRTNYVPDPNLDEVLDRHQNPMMEGAVGMA